MDARDVKYTLLAQGIMHAAATSSSRLGELLKSLHPIHAGVDLIRVGGESDGGYLLPNDLSGLTACYSPGVSNKTFFEEQLYRDFSIPCHLADASVDKAPTGFLEGTFLKRFLGPHTVGEFISIQDWLRLTSVGSDQKELLMQMDIEGHEYATLLACPIEVLKQFRIMIIEFHDIEAWADPVFFRLVEGLFLSLRAVFEVVHIHPNNCCGIVNISGIDLPRVFEMTLLRKDRVSKSVFRRDFPHTLDRGNLTSRPDLALPECWYHNS